MMWRLLALCAAMVAMATAKNVDWEAYKEKYDLVFEDHEETAGRKAFEANVKMIEDHNSDADRGMHTYWLGVNQFTHMTNEEYRAKVIGNCLLARNTTKWTADHVHEYDPKLTIPDTVDWKDQGYVTPVKNQKGCGSCWAFSTTGSVEGAHFNKTGKLVSLSEQQLMDCSWTYGNNGCNGGMFDRAFFYIKNNGGIDTEESYPYTARESHQCKFSKANVVATVTGYTYVTQGDEDALKTATATVGPISVAINAGLRSFQFYHSGVYDEADCTDQLNHGVLVVGYGTYQGKDYWLVKNSWAERWGLEGYIRMSRNKNNQCGIASYASYPLV